jgi:hypothetical protein
MHFITIQPNELNKNYLVANFKAKIAGGSVCLNERKQLGHSSIRQTKKFSNNAML